MKTPPEDQSGTESAKETNQVSKEGWIGNKPALTGTDWGLESGPRQTLKDRRKIGVTGRFPEYGKYGNQIWFPGALNLIGVPGYHSKNRNGTTNGAGKDPTLPAGHPTAPKTKTPMMNWVELTPLITRMTKNSTKQNEVFSIHHTVFKVRNLARNISRATTKNLTQKTGFFTSLHCELLKSTKTIQSCRPAIMPAPSETFSKSKWEN
jgi:hypothetical protein